MARKNARKIEDSSLIEGDGDLVIDSAGRVIRIDDRVYVPSRPSRLVKGQELPAISGYVVRVRPQEVLIREYRSAGYRSVRPFEVRVQLDRYGSVEACEYYLKYRKLDRVEQARVEEKLTKLLKRTKEFRPKHWGEAAEARA